VRHPKYWITGEPSVTPRTGPPAPTSDHQPSALTRSAGANSSRMIAMDAVPVAAPCTPSRTRANRSMPTSGAVAVRMALTIAPSRPNWYSLRWPKRSPALPKNGAATPKASSGPVEAHASTEKLVWKSALTVGRATTNTVNVMLRERRPANSATRAHHW
jgi:hypothetical protein